LSGCSDLPRREPDPIRVIAASRLVLVVCVIGFRPDGQTVVGRTGESTIYFILVILSISIVATD
jgi:hypothetical protein